MSVPAKYQPEPKKCEKKQWLYEKYWGELLTQEECADRADVGRKKIRMELDKHGIPTRKRGCGKGNQSPFRGFYNADENAVATEDSKTYYDESKQTDGQVKTNWMRQAETYDDVSLDWHKMNDDND